MAVKTRIKELVNRLQESFDGSPWYGDSVMKKLRSIDWYSADATPLEGNKSIAQILGHMINWRVFVLKKLEGDPHFDIGLNTLADWPKIEIENEKEWKVLVAELEQNQTTLVESLNKSSEALLETIVPGRDYTYCYLIEGIVQHDSYHLGQIGLLYRMVKSD